MSAKNPIRVYVTHCFASQPDYQRLFEYLESTANFFYVNCSSPDKVPQAGGKEALKEEYRRQIKQAEVVVVLSQMFVDNEFWTSYQMDAAQAMNIPLVALGFFGSAAKIPAAVVERAGETVEWNERQIADAIRHQARGEATNRWETIEFKL